MIEAIITVFTRKRERQGGRRWERIEVAERERSEAEHNWAKSRRVTRYCQDAQTARHDGLNQTELIPKIRRWRVHRTALRRLHFEIYRRKSIVHVAYIVDFPAPAVNFRTQPKIVEFLYLCDPSRALFNASRARSERSSAVLSNGRFYRKMMWCPVVGHAVRWLNIRLLRYSFDCAYSLYHFYRLTSHVTYIPFIYKNISNEFFYYPIFYVIYN